MATKKRKADEMSEDSDDVDHHLPAPVWGHVLDYMPYGEFRSALLVGKHIAVDAVQYVQVLNVMTASEMHVPAARRFANVDTVNILGFLQFSEMSKDITMPTGVIHARFPLTLRIEVPAIWRLFQN